MEYQDERKDRILRIAEAGKIGIEELIKVAKEPILSGTDKDPDPERLKTAAQKVKIAVFEAFDIEERIKAELDKLNSANDDSTKEEDKKPIKKQGWAERNAN